MSRFKSPCSDLRTGAVLCLGQSCGIISAIWGAYLFNSPQVDGRAYEAGRECCKMNQMAEGSLWNSDVQDHSILEPRLH